MWLGGSVHFASRKIFIDLNCSSKGVDCNCPMWPIIPPLALLKFVIGFWELPWMLTINWDTCLTSQDYILNLSRFPCIPKYEIGWFSWWEKYNESFPKKHFLFRWTIKSLPFLPFRNPSYGKKKTNNDVLSHFMHPKCNIIKFYCLETGLLGHFL